MTSLSNNYVKLTENFGIDGSPSIEQLEFLKSNYKSVLYLASDSTTDKGLV